MDIAVIDVGHKLQDLLLRIGIHGCDPFDEFVRFTIAESLFQLSQVLLCQLFKGWMERIKSVPCHVTKQMTHADEVRWEASSFRCLNAVTMGADSAADLEQQQDRLFRLVRLLYGHVQVADPQSRLICQVRQFVEMSSEQTEGL